MHYSSLSTGELALEAYLDPRYGKDPLFTALVTRLAQWHPDAHGENTRRQQQGELIGVFDRQHTPGKPSFERRENPHGRS